MNRGQGKSAYTALDESKVEPELLWLEENGYLKITQEDFESLQENYFLSEVTRGWLENLVHKDALVKLSKASPSQKASLALAKKRF